MLPRKTPPARRQGHDTEAAATIRTHPLPHAADKPCYLYTNDAALKGHADYKAAKAGNATAAGRLLRDLAADFIKDTARQFGDSVLFVAPHAREASGDNAIPQMLATALAIASGGRADENIVQRERVFHTGADPMERISLRPHFDGHVEPSANYVLVDDVSTMGTTIAELGHFIQSKGGQVGGVVLLVNASRTARLQPPKVTVRKIQERYGHDIEAIFGIQPQALTADEAGYLIGFRTADEIRNRVAKARQETHLRLRAKGIRRLRPQGRLSRTLRAIVRSLKRTA